MKKWFLHLSRKRWYLYTRKNLHVHELDNKQIHKYYFFKYSSRINHYVSQRPTKTLQTCLPGTRYTLGLTLESNLE